MIWILDQENMCILYKLIFMLWALLCSRHTAGGYRKWKEKTDPVPEFKGLSDNYCIKNCGLRKTVINVRSVFKVALEWGEREYTSVWKESGKASWSKWRSKWACERPGFTPPFLIPVAPSVRVSLLSLVHPENSTLEMWLMRHFSFTSFSEPPP